MSREPLRIAGASGFRGDRNDALLEQVRGGPIDGVMLDDLAEITMSIVRAGLAEGDDVVDQLGALADQGADLSNLDTDPIAKVLRMEVEVPEDLAFEHLV